MRRAAAGYPWAAIARELPRKGYVTCSGRPWTLWNVRSAYGTTTRIGTVVRMDLFDGASESAEDAAAVERCRRFEGEWFVRPIRDGIYPSAFLTEIPYDRMQIENPDLEAMQVPLDFLGLRVHERRTVANRPGSPPGFHDAGLGYEVSRSGRPIAPADAKGVADGFFRENGPRVHLA